MLSVGIRCGQGFDRNTLEKLIENWQRPYEFDVLILGSNPGGMSCAIEASNCGKKTALIHWRIPTPGEEEGIDEDMHQMSEALRMDRKIIKDRTLVILQEENKVELMSALKFTPYESTKGYLSSEVPPASKTLKWARKVRRSRLDLKNAIKNMGPEAMKFMHEIAMSKDRAADTNDHMMHSRISWGRMMEDVLDYLIKRNWNILTDLVSERIYVLKGIPIFQDAHTVKILKRNGEKRIITAETIISAVEIHNSFSVGVTGAREFGVNCDDFFRLATSPGKTLVVGASALGLECAGILSSFNLPVVVVVSTDHTFEAAFFGLNDYYRSVVLRDGDEEVVDMIVQYLMTKGVRFIAKKSLASIQKSRNGDAIVTEFVPTDNSIPSYRNRLFEEFDTVLFTTKEKPSMKKPFKSALQIEMERLSGEAYPPEAKQIVHVITEIPNKTILTELSGAYMAKKLFGANAIRPSYEKIPNTVLTPLEYAYMGVSETVAVVRLGEDCVYVFNGYFKTEDVIPERVKLRDDECFAKVIAATERDMILGLHLLGKDAIQIMGKVLDAFDGTMKMSNLHPAIKGLMKKTNNFDNEDESNEKLLFVHKF